MIDTRSTFRDYGRTFAAGAKTIDAFAVLIGGMTAFALMQPETSFANIPNRYLALLMFSAFLMLAVFGSNGVYDSWRGRSPLKLLQAVGLSWLLTVVSIGVLLFLSGHLNKFAPPLLMWWAGLSFLIMIVARTIAFGLLRVMRLRGWNRKRVVIIGTGALGRDLLQRVNSHPWTGFDVEAFFDDDVEADGPSIDGIPVHAGLSRLHRLVQDYAVSEVWIALPLSAEKRVQKILAELRHCTANIRFVPDFFGYRLFNHAVTNIAGRAMIDLSSSPMHGSNLIIKAMEDYLLATVLLVMTSPLMLVVALAVKASSPGPVVFRQKRHGWDGREITICKFRTMLEETKDPGYPPQARRNDPRLTPIGAFLRHFSLDELPQFINVLQGRMSIVGPRPHAVEHGEYFKDLVDDYMKRHRVKPGMTGWAQVNGYRGETDTVEKMEKRVEYDLFYIENWSLWLDLKIVLLTTVQMIAGKNAY
ncbi:MAG: undecaprenyl-phosphate glucose phosphotransferase [Pseudomonadota bacterium]